MVKGLGSTIQILVMITSTTSCYFTLEASEINMGLGSRGFGRARNTGVLEALYRA